MFEIIHVNSGKKKKNPFETKRKSLMFHFCYLNVHISGCYYRDNCTDCTWNVNIICSRRKNPVTFILAMDWATVERDVALHVPFNGSAGHKFSKQIIIFLGNAIFFSTMFMRHITFFPFSNYREKEKKNPPTNDMKRRRKAIKNWTHAKPSIKTNKGRLSFSVRFFLFCRVAFLNLNKQ